LVLKYPQLAGAVKHLEARALPEGGFAARGTESFRSDATAWAIVALSRSVPNHPLVDRARDRLAAAQGSDGRVSVSKEHGEAFWPTALSVLAWHGSRAHELQYGLGIQFLLRTMGRHWHKNLDAPMGHDPSIPGWPWIDGTHSWI